MLSSTVTGNTEFTCQETELRTCYPTTPQNARPDFGGLTGDEAFANTGRRKLDYIIDFSLTLLDLPFSF